MALVTVTKWYPSLYHGPQNDSTLCTSTSRHGIVVGTVNGGQITNQRLSYQRTSSQAPKELINLTLQAIK